MTNSRSEMTQTINEMAEETIPDYNESTGDGYHQGHVFRKCVTEFGESLQTAKRYLDEMFIKPGILVRDQQGKLYAPEHYQEEEEEKDE